MASISKNGKGYQITINLGTTKDGKRIRKRLQYIPKSKSRYKSVIEKEVKEYAEAQEKRIKKGVYSEGEEKTYYEIYQEWLNSQIYQNLTDGQKEQYVRDIETKGLPTLSNMKISSIKARDCQQIIDEMASDGYAYKTIKRMETAVGSVFKYAFQMEIIDVNPFSRCQFPKQKKNTVPQCFNLEQTQAFFNALDMKYPYTYTEHASKNKITKNTQNISEYTAYRKVPLQFKVFFYLAIYGGFRRGELLALTWKDINFNDNSISINKAIGSRKGGQYIKDTKTESSVRDIVLPKICFDLLQQWYIEEKSIARNLGTAWKGYHGKQFDRSFIFIQKDGALMDGSSPNNKFKAIISAYNDLQKDENKKLPKIHLHNLRHTCATILLSEGADIETVSHRLGHSKVSTTLDIYGHALKEKDVSASNLLGNLFNNTSKTIENC